MSNFGKTLRSIRLQKQLSQEQLATLLGTSRQVISRYEKGQRSPRISTCIEWAEKLGVTLNELNGSKFIVPESVIPLDNMSQVPIVGDIACGTPILAEQNIDGYINIAPGIPCDFALLCKGDSMEPRFYDGDYVLIRQQEDVDDGQIAAVYIDGDATLKHVQHLPGGVLLIPENTGKYKAQSFTGADAENIRIMGRAVGYQRAL